MLVTLGILEQKERFNGRGGHVVLNLTKYIRYRGNKSHAFTHTRALSHAFNELSVRVQDQLHASMTMCILGQKKRSVCLHAGSTRRSRLHVRVTRRD